MLQFFFISMNLTKLRPLTHSSDWMKNLEARRAGYAPSGLKSRDFQIQKINFKKTKSQNVYKIFKSGIEFSMKQITFSTWFFLSADTTFIDYLDFLKSRKLMTKYWQNEAILLKDGYLFSQNEFFLLDSRNLSQIW